MISTSSSSLKGHARNAVAQAVWFIALACGVQNTSAAVDGVAITCRNPKGPEFYGQNRDAEIWRRTISASAVTSEARIHAGPATHARFSPNGKQIAFARGDGKICVMSIDGGTETPLCDGFKWSIVNWPANDWIYFNMGAHDVNCGKDCGIIKRVNVTTKAVELIDTIRYQTSGNPIRLFDFQVASDLTRMLFRPAHADCGSDNAGDPTEAVVMLRYIPKNGNDTLLKNNSVAFDYAGGTKFVGGRCGMGLSFDGNYTWCGNLNHTKLEIRRYGSTDLVSTLATGFSPAGVSRAVNDTAWILNGHHGDPNCYYQSGGSCTDTLAQSLVNWVSGEKINLGTGDCGDFWVNAGIQSTPPTITLSKSQVTFLVTQGSASPAQVIQVSNGGSGHLDAVAAPPQISYNAAAGWLSVGITGSGNSQTATTTVNLSGLTIGTYTATVTIRVPNAVPSSNSFGVTLTIASQNQELTSLRITPATTTITTWSFVALSATGLDQNGVAVVPQPVMRWSISGLGGATIDSAKGVFCAGQSAGDYTITANAAGGTGATVTATARVAVIRAISITAFASSDFRVGDTLDIRWAIIPEKTGTGVAISFSADSGLQWVTLNNVLIKNNDPAYSSQNSGLYRWPIPLSCTDGVSTIQTTSPGCQIRIEAPYEANRPVDYSPVFAINTVNPATGLRNLAHNKCYSTGCLGYPHPCNAFDGDTATPTGNQNGSSSPRLVTDFGTLETVTKTVVYFNKDGDPLTSYSIESSADGANWAMLRSVASPSQTDSQTGLSAKCRYLRFAFAPYSNTWDKQIAEIQVWGDPALATRTLNPKVAGQRSFRSILLAALSHGVCNVEIYDLSGKKTRWGREAVIGSGYSVSVNTLGLPYGSYIVKITAGSWQYRERVIVLR